MRSLKPNKARFGTISKSLISKNPGRFSKMISDIKSPSIKHRVKKLEQNDRIQHLSNTPENRNSHTYLKLKIPSEKINTSLEIIKKAREHTINKHTISKAVRKAIREGNQKKMLALPPLNPKRKSMHVTSKAVKLDNLSVLRRSDQRRSYTPGLPPTHNVTRNRLNRNYITSVSTRAEDSPSEAASITKANNLDAFYSDFYSQLKSSNINMSKKNPLKLNKLRLRSIKDSHSNFGHRNEIRKFVIFDKKTSKLPAIN